MLTKQKNIVLNEQVKNLCELLLLNPVFLPLANIKLSTDKLNKLRNRPIICSPKHFYTSFYFQVNSLQTDLTSQAARSESYQRRLR